MAKTKDISLSLIRTIKATPEKVYAALTEPKTLKKWMSPSDAMDVTIAETDLKIGGKYRIVMREPDGKEYRVGGVYKELSPGRKLVFTWGWDGSQGSETLVTIELRKNGAGTELSLTHTKFVDEASRDMHSQGWAGCVGRLEKLMAA